MYEAPAATFMTGTLQSANKSVQDWIINIFTFSVASGHEIYGQLSLATFNGPPAELENLGPWTRLLFQLPSLLQGDMIEANLSRQERKSVSQTPNKT